MRAAGRCLIAGLLGAAIAQQAAAADLPAANDTPSAQRPRIGLVLSGGGARGGAHIGVLKVLEALHVPVDVIVGTSAGAIVGSAYASGLPLAEIEHEMAALNTAVLFRDTDRAEVPLRRKLDDATNFIGPEFGLGPHGLMLPKGAVAGVSLEVVLRRLTRRQTTTDFDRLPIPFRAVATDLTSAEMVALSHGQLALAARASMAIPGAMNPVEIDGHLLVDGGLKRNLPVDVARRLGADVVIAVNIGTPLLRRDEITSVVSVSDQMLRILIGANVQQSLTELKPGDVLIAPELGEISSSAFDQLAEAARRGERAAQAVASQLAPYGLPADVYAALMASRFAAPGDTAATIDEVRVVGTHVVNPEVVLAAMQTRAGEALDPQRVDRDIKRIYARGDFEAVNYTLVDEAGSRVLLAEVSEKSWGPNYLRLGLGLSSDFEGNAFFNLYASHRWTWLNALGAELRNDLQIGRTDRLATEWYQPLTARQRAFVAPRIELQDEPFDVYDRDSGLRVARFRRESVEAGLDLGLPLGRSGEARLGLARGSVKFRDDTTTVRIGGLIPRTDTGGVLLRVRVDQLDSLRFPRDGVAGDARVYFSRSRLGAQDDYTRASVNLQGAHSWGPHAVRGALKAGGNLKQGTLPAYELFSLGGFLQLSGYRTGQLLGTEMRFGRVAYNYRLAGPGLLDGIVVGASLEAGRIGDSVFGADKDRLRRGRALYLALDTLIGPVYLAIGMADSGNRAAYFFLGQP